MAWQVDQMPHAPQWLTAARDFWREQTIYFGAGCIGVGLDRILINQERIVIVRKLVQRVFNIFYRFGEYVPRDFLNTRCQLYPTSGWLEDVEAEWFLSYGRILLKLLDGKLTAYQNV